MIATDPVEDATRAGDPENWAEGSHENVDHEGSLLSVAHHTNDVVSDPVLDSTHYEVQGCQCDQHIHEVTLGQNVQNLTAK